MKTLSFAFRMADMKASFWGTWRDVLFGAVRLLLHQVVMDEFFRTSPWLPAYHGHWHRLMHRVRDKRDHCIMYSHIWRSPLGIGLDRGIWSL